MVQLPNHMPTHSSDEVPGHMARSCLTMGLDCHQVISDVAWYVGEHGMREKLEEQISGQLPAIIGGTMVPVAMHRPPMPPVNALVHGKNRGLHPASQGLSTLGGGYCHDLLPALSPINHIHSVSLRLTPPLPFPTLQATPINPDYS